MDEIDEAFQRIQSNPKLWAEGYRGVRRAKLSRFPYIVYFLIDELMMDVVAVQHFSRHARDWQSRL